MTGIREGLGCDCADTCLAVGHETSHTWELGLHGHSEVAVGRVEAENRVGHRCLLRSRGSAARAVLRCRLPSDGFLSRSHLGRDSHTTTAVLLAAADSFGTNGRFTGADDLRPLPAGPAAV